MTSLFPPLKPLLNPLFETYKLHSLSADTDVLSYPLPGGGATQSRVGYSQNSLSFKETRNRIGWDHLCVSGSRGIYVDVNWEIVGFQLDEELVPTFTTLATLPTPISSSSNQQFEYPSILAVSPVVWLVSSGTGSLYVLKTSPPSESFSANLIARYDLSPSPSPFLLQAIHQLSESRAKILLSKSVIPEDSGKYRPHQTTFQLVECELSLDNTNNIDIGEELKVNWRLNGGDLPVSCEWWEGGWLVLSAEEFTEAVQKEEDVEMSEPAKLEERKSKLGLGASLSGEERGQTASVEEISEDQEWPYTWTQNSTSLSVSFSLPATTTRNHIKLNYNSTDFSLSITNLDPSHRVAEFTSKPTRQFWTTIDPSESTWTFDPATTTLELDLTKTDENTRWPSVFTPDDNLPNDDEVPETIPESALSAIRETFASVKTRQPDEPAGNHPALPGLLREEMDFDLEDGEELGEEAGPEGMFGEGSKVGREVVVGHLVSDENGVKTNWSKQTNSVISLPFHPAGGVMIKSAVDGLLFSPDSTDPTKEPWTHVSTSPALAFVLSSKRDLRLVRHLSSHSSLHSAKRQKKSEGTTVFAFESGSSVGSGNVYIYYPVSGKVGKQGVVVVSGASRGALLGVGCCEVSGREVVVALCEKELVVLPGVL